MHKFINYSNLMSNQRIEKRIYDSYSDFSKEYIKSMELKISTEKFGELRKHFISILFEVNKNK